MLCVGLTETCAGSFVSLPNELSMLGTVGPPVPNVDVCLESVPEMNYDANGSSQRGEICIRGNTLFSGYYKREDLTKEVMIDGWFHTGLSILISMLLHKLWLIQKQIQMPCLFILRPDYYTTITHLACGATWMSANHEEKRGEKRTWWAKLGRRGVSGCEGIRLITCGSR